MHNIKYTIIVPVKKLNNYIYEQINVFEKFKRRDFEVLIIENNLSNKKFECNFFLKIIESGKVSPAFKRDLGARNARGDYLVFFDDDSYPSSTYFDCLDNLVHNNLNIIGGPAITPLNVSIKERISGAVYSNEIFDNIVMRYIKLNVKENLIDDWPSVNLVVKKDIYNEVGGFNTNLWPGEDAEFCNKIVYKYGYQINYSKDLYCYHHRRKTLIGHFKQICSYGLHRGFLAKKNKTNSKKILYFGPSIFILIWLFSFLSLFNKLFLPAVLILIIYILIYFYSFFIKRRNETILVRIISLPILFIGHFLYGLYFLKGWNTKNLKSKLR